MHAPHRAIPSGNVPRRNRGYDETHRELIETAVRLISEKGAESLSIAALARALGINRTTVYYHFASREALLEAVTQWATSQLTRGMDMAAPQPERVGGISRFVLDNPDLIKLWIDDFVSGTDIRQSYPRWDELVAGLDRRFRELWPDDAIDAEVYAAILLAGSIIGPRVFAQSIRPQEDRTVIAEKFLREQQRQLRRDGLIIEPEDMT